MSRLCIWYETVRRKKNKHARRVHCPLLLHFGGCRTKLALRCTAVAKNFSALRRDLAFQRQPAVILLGPTAEAEVVGAGGTTRRAPYSPRSE